MAAASFPPALAFFADCDGAEDEFLVALAQRAEPGSRQLFACCVGFEAATEVLQFLRAHRQPASAAYVNWVGRTVRQIREEAALREALTADLDANAATLAGEAPQTVHRNLVAFADAQVESGALTLTPPEPAPASWFFRNLFKLIGVPLVLMLATPVFVLYLPLFLWQLRRRETTDPVILSRPDPAKRPAIAACEDHDVTNPISSSAISSPAGSGSGWRCFCCG
jgi:hypothetical protein